MESIEQTLDRLESIYDAAVERLRADVIAFGRERELPAPERRSDGSSSYPELRLLFRGGDQRFLQLRAYLVLEQDEGFQQHFFLGLGDDLEHSRKELFAVFQ